MYPSRGGPSASGHRDHRATDWLEHRREMRERVTKSIWPSSPKAPAPDDSPPRRRKRSRSINSESETDSEEEHRRRKHKHSRRRDDDDHRHKSSRHRSSRSRKHHTSRRHRSSDDESSYDYESERERRRHGRRDDKEKSKAKDRSLTPLHTDEDDESAWVEKPPGNDLTRTMQSVPNTVGTMEDSASITAATSAFAQTSVNSRPAQIVDDDDSDEVGPMPYKRKEDKIDEREYGSALLRGEGSAMAAFVQSNQRIPRRGEIGLTCNEIDQYEKSGYVMSGSRHRRMNAVRMRKENQVISAEEKRGILKLQKEEREKRENLIVGGFKEMLEEKLKGTTKNQL